jgi:serine O-acetyltransferase
LIKELKYDVHRYGIPNSSGIATILRNVVFAYGFQAIAVYRFGQWIGTWSRGPLMWPLKSVLYLVYQLTAWYIRKAYGIDLSPKAKIGPGLYIGHFGGIEVGPCTIGSNCSIQQHVKILPDKRNGHRPHIGSSVWIGGHARIEGCTIGDRATISAGAAVCKDVESMNLVAGNPARVVAKNYDNNEILGILL